MAEMKLLLTILTLPASQLVSQPVSESVSQPTNQTYKSFNTDPTDDNEGAHQIIFRRLLRTHNMTRH